VSNKLAVVTGIAAVYVACPECGGECTQEGSLMVIPTSSEVVTCTSCFKNWNVPVVRPSWLQTINRSLR